jgi:hypothetical protein
VRTVFLLLLSANLLFLAWARWIDSPREQAGQDALAHLPRLQLVTEPTGSKPLSANPPSAEAAPASVPIEPVSTAAPQGSAPPSGGTEQVALRASDPSSSCTTVGPFSDLASAARAAGLLTQRGFQLRQRAEEGETIEGYWVFVGDLQSDDEAGRVVDRLAKSGLTDAHVMKSYSTTRRLSVGMFSSRARAERRAAVVRNMGLAAEIGERKFPGTVYWVDVLTSRGTGQHKLPPDYTFSEIGGGKIGMQSCPVLVHPAPPPEAVPDEDGVMRAIPRSTVASAPVHR